MGRTIAGVTNLPQAKMDSQHSTKVDSQPREQDLSTCMEPAPAIHMGRTTAKTGAMQRTRQTPMTSFTFKQSLDEQRSGMNIYAAQALKQRELANIAKDMSSSSLATRTPRHTRRTQSALAETDASMMSPKRLKNVADIATYFGKGQKADERLNILENNSNNNTVCLAPACDKLTAPPAISTQPYQQMSGQALNSAQPIGSQMTCQVIGKWVPEPIKTMNSQMIQNPEKGGHLGE